MNKELQSIKDQVGYAQEWYPVAAAVQRLCDCLAELEERIAELETRCNQVDGMQLEAMERGTDGES